MRSRKKQFVLAHQAQAAREQERYVQAQTIRQREVQAQLQRQAAHLEQLDSLVFGNLSSKVIEDAHMFYYFVQLRFVKPSERINALVDENDDEYLYEKKFNFIELYAKEFGFSAEVDSIFEEDDLLSQKEFIEFKFFTYGSVLVDGEVQRTNCSNHKLLEHSIGYSIF